jgi:hypothetical protein
MGGMGNQMWQYAFGLGQARRLGVDLHLDITQLGGHRPLSLYQWEVDNVELCTGRLPTILEQGLNYNQALVDRIKDGDVLQGYWQNEKYILPVEDELRKTFVPITFSPNRSLLRQVMGYTSVVVHVRRGDYLIEPHKSFHGVLGIDYYERAFNEIYKHTACPQFFIFSDDPAWVREHFAGENVTVVERGHEAEDIYQGSLCRHAIIANSSFSWWAGWLGDGKLNRVVIAPEKWFDQAKEDYSGIVPKRWMKI